MIVIACSPGRYCVNWKLQPCIITNSYVDDFLWQVIFSPFMLVSA
ncbi:hypothetical protein BMETH_1868_0 [methanotrophic bacterial endosymbiont of Bathymodiolus sp.]|nr:hypothetical protein BMETH_1868_0 [methanotrophic bacterial endosymbiont of Bathymodiolus sp.]